MMSENFTDNSTSTVGKKYKMRIKFKRQVYMLILVLFTMFIVVLTVIHIKKIFLLFLCIT